MNGVVSRYAGLASGVGPRFGGLAHIADLEVFVRDEVVLTDQAQRGLVGVVESLSADLAMQGSDLPGGALVVLRAGPGLAAGES
jgi:hypothetical protein